MKIPSLDHIYSDGLALLEIADCLDIECTPDMLDRGRNAIKDIVRLQTGWRPGEEVLSAAPTLSEWAIVEELGAGLAQFVGRTVGHPTFPNHRVVRTSIIIALDTRHLKWARTIGRFYRLLAPEEPLRKLAFSSL
jgi:hypothetical protein